MRHFVQYHNPDVIGRPYRRTSQDFAIVSDKFFKSLVGATVWLVTSKGRPRRYFLCASFVVDKVERANAGKFRNRASGSVGQDFDVEIGNEPWFRELLKLTGNFGLGLMPLSSRAVIEGLKNCSELVGEMSKNSLDTTNRRHQNRPHRLDSKTKNPSLE